MGERHSKPAKTTADLTASHAYAAIIALQRVYEAKDLEAAHAIAAGSLMVLAPDALEQLIDRREREKPRKKKRP